MDSARRRVLVTALLALAGAMIGVPGVGHAYLRRWKRSLLWLTVTLGAGILLLSYYVPDPSTLDPFDFDAIPMEVRLTIFVITAVSVFDATLLAYLDGRSTAGIGSDDEPSEEGTRSCPHCGKPTDADLDFCTWCTEPLADTDAVDDTSTEPDQPK
ncbi:zinc ribbon domain-containing protein [Halonotius aquaticus]|uniref:Zinc ribbon domain-containing protein n=1 Tax=Halonotius aquaticus TaxID=2216978 RepID=A0A3A6PL12_9EURY|nr:zinc ribbon domain-containing protein [Halonotius aquaticus]RJX42057.1 zinc ribbon domain-containing protein [Halonotius aquaticus]